MRNGTAYSTTTVNASMYYEATTILRQCEGQYSSTYIGVVNIEDTAKFARDIALCPVPSVVLVDRGGRTL
jgi:hypothetical protein